MPREPQTTDGRPNYCLHAPHPDPVIEATARKIYMSRYGAQGGWWELNETPEHWWVLAAERLNARLS
jgi:hypothetical protein